MAASSDGWVFAVNANGAPKWQVQLGERIQQQGSNLGLDGTFYCISAQRRLFAVSAGGQLLWNLYDPQFSGATHCVLTFSPDGRTLYVPGEGVAVSAVDIESQAIRWRFGTSDRLEVAPMVDSYGNIYVLGVDSIVAPEPSLISLRPDGTVRWIFTHGNRFDQIYAGDPTIDMSGNIYFILDSLYSVDWNGNLRWKRDLTLAGSRPAGDVPLVCDAAGRVHTTVLDIGPDRYTSIAFGGDGSVLWSMVSSNGYWIDTSPAIPWSGTLVMAGLKNTKLYNLE